MESIGVSFGERKLEIGECAILTGEHPRRKATLRSSGLKPRLAVGILAFLNN